MRSTDTLHSVFQENKNLAKEYIDVRLQLYKLVLIRIFSRSAGNLLWIIISIVLLSLFLVFAGIVTGFWLSELTGSYLSGFGVTTLLIFFVFGILALFRKQLFINPLVRSLIRNAAINQDDSADKN